MPSVGRKPSTNPTRQQAPYAKLIKSLSEGASISAACKVQGIDRSTYYKWRKDDPDFAQRADDAIEDGTDLLEDIAFERASQTSDTLIQVLLKARRPRKYKDNQSVEITGNADAPLKVVIERVSSAG